MEIKEVLEGIRSGNFSDDDMEQKANSLKKLIKKHTGKENPYKKGATELQIVEMYYMQRMTIPEIAKKLGYDEDYMKQRKRSGIKYLSFLDA